MAIEDYDNPNREFKPKNRGIMEEENQWPQWLKPLLNQRFFVQCKSHEHSPKSECNMYCLDCTNDSFCSLCLPHHNNHRTIQIRRLSYHDVIRVNEIQKYLDISSIHPYVINSSRVVFLNARPQTRHGKGVTNTCEVCYRGLVENCFRFCSIGCKVVGTSGIIKNGMKQTLIESDNSSNSNGVENNSSGADNKSSNLQSFNQLASPDPTGSIRKRRRKGIPHRSPLS